MSAIAGSIQAPREKPRLEYIDGLRALAALYVVVHHILLYLYDGLPDGRPRHVANFLLMGHFAVDVFIVISGFCLMLPVIRNHVALSGGALHFFKKRARRILPPYYSVLAFSLLLIWFLIGKPTGSTWNSALPVTWTGLLAHILVVQDLFSSTHHQINYVLWTISVEWRIYFLFPLLVLSWNRIGPFLTVALTTGISFLLLFLLPYTFIDTSSGGACVHFYGLFSFGMLAAGFAYSADPLLVRWRNRIPWAALFLIFAVIGLGSDKGHFRQLALSWQAQDLFIGLGTLCMLVAISPGARSDSWRWARNALGWRPLAFVGTFSYSLYLIHAPLIEVIWVYLVHPLHMNALNSWVLFSTVGLLAIVGIAYLFFLICERPFMGPPGGPSAGARRIKPQSIPGDAAGALAQ